MATLESSDRIEAASVSDTIDTLAIMSAQDLGRRILSTAFVRVGPDGRLTIGLRNGATMVLRDVTIGLESYCGKAVSDGAKYCGGYADVVSAAPGGGPTPTTQVQPASGAPGPPT